jgi:hypothetical protein
VKRSDYPAYESALDRVEKLRDSRWVPAIVLSLALTGSALNVIHGFGTPKTNWAATGLVSFHGFSPAGWWYLALSVPLFQILLLGWLWRWILWTTFLWRVSRLDLQLLATNADHASGLGFLGHTAASFSFVAFGPSAVVTVSWVSQIVNDHVPIQAYWGPMIGIVVIVLALVFAPLTVFWQRLRRTQHECSERYGVLVYNRRFDRKWIGPGARTDDESLTALDAQNMADLANVYDTVAHTRAIPFEPSALIDLGVATLLPMLPLLLASTSPKEILKRIVDAVV